MVNKASQPPPETPHSILGQREGVTHDATKEVSWTARSESPLGINLPFFNDLGGRK